MKTLCFGRSVFPSRQLRVNEPSSLVAAVREVSSVHELKLGSAVYSLSNLRFTVVISFSSTHVRAPCDMRGGRGQTDGLTAPERKCELSWSSCGSRDATGQTETFTLSLHGHDAPQHSVCSAALHLLPATGIIQRLHSSPGRKYYFTGEDDFFFFFLNLFDKNSILNLNCITTVYHSVQ